MAYVPERPGALAYCSAPTIRVPATDFADAILPAADHRSRHRVPASRIFAP